MQRTQSKVVMAIFAILPAWPARSAPIVEVQLRVVTAPSNDETFELPISVVAACVGVPMFLEVWTTNFGASSPGIAGGTVDIGFSAVVEPVEIDHGLVFQKLPTGTTDVAAGTITDLGGNTFIAGAGAAPSWALLARVSFTVFTEGDAVFDLSPGTLRFALAGGRPPLDFGTDVLLGPGVVLSIGTPGAYGDFDCDADVGLSDFAVMKACFAGPDVTSPDCDVDLDGDTDLFDFAEFQADYTSDLP